ncbi:MAG: Appr-1-p processing protein, partial [Bacteroidia bacterium]
KVKHVLYYLNGSYIMGYSSKDKKPFEELYLIADAEMEVNQFLDKPENANYKNIAKKTKLFLAGFYSSFGLELLSTVDFIISEKKADTKENIIQELESWSDRKKTLFTNPKFVQIALNNLKLHLN